jgi:predicted nucleic acid-binding protein
LTGFLDTNVLLYAALHPADEERAKRDRARALLESGDCVLSLQVLQEFVHQATHSRRVQRLSLDEAMSFVAVFRNLPVLEPTIALLDEGVRLFGLGGLSFWDAMIVAAAIAQGCDLLYSEDMQHNRVIAGVRIVNPFD